MPKLLGELYENRATISETGGVRNRFEDMVARQANRVLPWRTRTRGLMTVFKGGPVRKGRPGAFRQ
jgi:hypothetical protein